MKATRTPKVKALEAETERDEIESAPAPRVSKKVREATELAEELEHADEELDADAAIAEAEEAKWTAELRGEPDADEPDADEQLTGYHGTMIALRKASAAGRYSNAANGQPCCMDVVAQALGSLPPLLVIKACMIALNLPANPYAHLNVGQQSMNLRNKIRGAMKRAELEISTVLAAIDAVTPTQAEEVTA